MESWRNFDMTPYRKGVLIAPKEIKEPDGETGAVGSAKNFVPKGHNEEPGHENGWDFVSPPGQNAAPFWLKGNLRAPVKNWRSNKD